MKPLIPSLALLAVLALAHLAGAATPEEETRFLGAVREAYQKKDKAALIALTCWDGVTEQHKKMADKVLEYGFSRPVQTIEYKAVEATEGQGYTHEGVTYGPNLAIIKSIEIVYAVPTGSQKSQIFVGEKSGKLMIVNAAPKP